MATLSSVRTALLAPTRVGLLGSAAVTPTAPPSTKSTDAQRRDFKLAYSDYIAEGITWRSREIERRKALIPVVLDVLPWAAKNEPNQARWALKGAFGNDEAAAERARLLLVKYGSNLGKLTDPDMDRYAQATDLYFNRYQQPSKWVAADPVAGTGGRRVGHFVEMWQLLRDGEYGQGAGGAQYPNAADPSLDLTMVAKQYGLKGLHWYTQAVPAVRFLARIRKDAPSLPETQTWIEKLTPLTYSGVTQGDLEAETGRVAFSNPLAVMGKASALVGALVGAKGPTTDYGDQTQAPAEESTIPWGTIIVLLLIAGGVYWYLTRRKKGA